MAGVLAVLEGGCESPPSPGFESGLSFESQIPAAQRPTTF